MIDLDQFEERAAIIEYMGGETRFRAETLAAKAMGFQRKELLDAIVRRNSRPASDHRSADARHPEGRVSAVQPEPKKQARPVPERHIQG